MYILKYLIVIIIFLSTSINNFAQCDSTVSITITEDLSIKKLCKQIPPTEDGKSGINLFVRDDICKPNVGFAGLYNESLILNDVTKRFEYSYEYYNKISMISLTDEGLFYMEADTLNLIHSELGKKYFEESYNPELATGEYRILIKEFSGGQKKPIRNMGFGIYINDTTRITVFKGLEIWNSTENIETIQISTDWIPFQSKKYKVTPLNNEFVFYIFDEKIFDKVTYLWQKDELIPIGTEGISGKCKMILQTPKK